MTLRRQVQAGVEHRQRTAPQQPAERSPEGLARLDQKMKDAEASHAILLVATLLVVCNAAARGWWTAAAFTLLFDVLLNGYPVMLQRYNRALLYARFPAGILSR